MKLTFPPAWKLDWGILTSRLFVAVLLALLSLLTQRGLPHETRDLIAYGAAAVGAALTALPSAFQAAGLVRPVSPEFASLCQRLGQLFARPGVSTADVQAAAKAEMQNAMPQLIQLAADEVLNRSNMYGYSPDELGKKAVPDSDGPDAPAAPSTPPLEAETATDATMLKTGDNQ